MTVLSFTNTGTYMKPPCKYIIFTSQVTNKTGKVNTKFIQAKSRASVEITIKIQTRYQNVFTASSFLMSPVGTTMFRFLLARCLQSLILWNESVSAFRKLLVSRSGGDGNKLKWKREILVGALIYLMWHRDFVCLWLSIFVVKRSFMRSHKNHS